MHISSSVIMMTGFNMKNVSLAVLVGLLLLLGMCEAQSNQDCCLSYTKKPIPRRVIIGFTEQLSSEVCDINAVIFHTKGGLRACANPTDPWVKKQLHLLSKKLNKLSQFHRF
ncbi:C-C motif chemokine 20 [Zootoca vivipara]|uniref:C-C motif chemokine 20 n=1 Tax=Zootoca vivipara TaxID=8524 RepID=UPI00159245FD|nr:C-C motif chemokine 20 [Zootoca vivipara]